MNILNWNKYKSIINQQYFSGIISVTIFLLIWEAVMHMGFVGEIFLSRPSNIFSAGLQMVVSGSLWSHLLISMGAFSIGLFFAIIFAVTSGIYIGLSKSAYDMLRPFIFSLNALPKVAIIPLIMIWFGIGFFSKVVIIFLMVISPILINVLDAVRGMDKNYLKIAQSFEAGNYYIIKSIVFFQALPAIFSGIRIAIGKGITGIVIAEVFGYGTGLGFLISRYGTSYQTARLMFVIFVLLIISLVAVWLNELLRRSIVRWEN